VTLQELRFLVALANEKHFRKASEICFVSQPSLSIAIRKLEEGLGVVIFERNKNEVKITALGEQIVDRAKRVLEEAENIKQLVLSDKDQLNSIFKLGAIYTIGPYLLPPLITRLHKTIPGMPIEIQEDYTVNLRKKLVNGDVDAVLVSQPFTASGVVTRNLYKESFVVLLPAKHPLTKYKAINESMLSDHNVLLLGEGHCFREQVISSCPNCFNSIKSSSGINWKTVEGSSLETIRHMVASGLGITILPQSAAATGSYRSNMLITKPLKGSYPERTIALAWRNTFPRIKAIEFILEAIMMTKLV
jgi:LysR family hydrogen peroxide-inducible transcriptional activator